MGEFNKIMKVKEEKQVAKKSLEKFENLPTYIMEALKNFLEIKRNYNNLQKHLRRTAVILEKDDYQISISDIQELKQIRNFLKRKL